VNRKRKENASSRQCVERTTEANARLFRRTLESSSPPAEEARRLFADEGDRIGHDVLDDRWALAAQAREIAFGDLGDARMIPRPSSSGSPPRRSSPPGSSCGECCGPSSNDGSSRQSSRSNSGLPLVAPSSASDSASASAAQANGCVRGRGFAGRRPRRFGARAGRAESSPHMHSCESRDQTAWRAITPTSSRRGRMQHAQCSSLPV
jgi:hypothetical protein